MIIIIIATIANVIKRLPYARNHVKHSATLVYLILIQFHEIVTLLSLFYIQGCPRLIDNK